MHHLAVVACLILSTTAGSIAAQPLSALFARPEPLLFRLPPTLSEQFYSDVLVYGDWRLERSEVTGRFQLVDANGLQRVSGDEQHCRKEFQRLKQAGVIPTLSGRAVITLHGFGRSRDHMQPLGLRLQETGDYTWINFNYSSTRGSLDDHAHALAQVIAGLEGIDQIDVVAHSLGNLVVRRYLGEVGADQPRWQPDKRLRRMVMLGPPNNGARMATLIADTVHDNGVARLVTGPSAWQLAREWDQACKLLATPKFEFGVIAGGFEDNRGFNPLLPGDDDLVVSVDETRLVGAADFRLVPCRHGRMMRDPQVQDLVLRFLEQGCFTSAGEKQPILAPDTGASTSAAP